MNAFAVLYLRGPKWDPQRKFHEQDAVERHRDFLQAQHKQGRLIFGGPFIDDTGGLAVYRAASKGEVEALILSDETVQNGLLRYEIHPYIIAYQA